VGQPSGLSEPKPQGSHEGKSRAGIFARVGEVWTIGLDDKGLPFRDLKGFHYIERLLQHPGQEFHALDILREPAAAGGREEASKADLLSNPSIHIEGLGDAGEMLDARAKEEYGHKLRELREELEEHREKGNEEGVDEIENEIDFITREITRAVGRGGRDRRAGSAAERARLNVTRAIRTALEKISEHDRPIAELLDRSIRTGIFCRYVVDPNSPIAWRFSPNEQSAELGASSSFAPAPTTPSIQLMRSNLIGSFADRTTFVGRDKERSMLRAVLDQVRAGSGQVVMVAGPPGVGKTRIAVEFALRAEAEGVSVLTGACYDRDDAVPFIPFVEMFESALAQAKDPQAFRRMLGGEASELARLMPQLRRLFPDIPPSMDLPPEQTRRMLFAASAQFLARLAGDRPLLLIADDLHWADEGTLSLVEHLARSFAKVPIMIVGTYRDNQVDRGGPLAKLLDELTRIHLLSEITLSGLSQDAVGAMLSGLSRREAPAELTKVIFGGTEGNPFFVEELFRDLVEHGKIFAENGDFRRDLTTKDLRVPPNLQLVIGRRLGRLSAPTRETLEAAAVVGLSFPFDLLQSSLGIDSEQLLDHLEEGEGAGLLSSSLQGSEARFHFSHELIRQTALAGISTARRQRLHLKVADAIEKLRPEGLEEQVNDLAHHLWQAGTTADTDRTLRSLAMAGHRAIEQSAHKAALLYLDNARELIHKVPRSKERDQMELGIQIDYGLAMVQKEGEYVAEYADAFKRARELCRETGENHRLFSVLSGLTNHYKQKPDFQLTLSYCHEMVQLARNAGDDEMLVQAQWAFGSTNFFMGDFTGAHANFESCIRTYDPQKHRTLSYHSGESPLHAFIFDAMTLWILGYPEQAEKRLQESNRISRELDPFTLVAFLCMAAKYDSIRRDFQRAARWIQEGRERAAEHDFGFYKEGLIAYQSIGLAAMGKLEELRDISRQHRRMADAGYELAQTWARSYLAEGLSNAGRADVAQTLIEQALDLVKRNGERYAESEVHRIKGEIALKRISTGEHSTAETKAIESSAEESFRSAIDVAREQGAKSFELRASLAMSRLLVKQARRAEARQLLGEIRGKFTEGFTMPELQEAQSILASL